MGKKHIEEEEHNDFSMSIGDLMAAVLFIFVILLVGAVAMLEKDKKQLGEKTQQVEVINKNVLQTRKNIRDGIRGNVLDSVQSEYMELIDSSLVIRIRSDRYVMFAKDGDTELTDSAKRMLKDFFPKYLSFLTSDSIRNKIASVDIEGHCNSNGFHGKTEAENYRYNMELSQKRAHSVLFACESFVTDSMQLKWMRKYMSAVGYSYSRPLYIDTTNTTEDKEGSKRVEFCITTDDAAALKEFDEVINGTK